MAAHQSLTYSLPICFIHRCSTIHTVHLHWLLPHLWLSWHIFLVPSSNVHSILSLRHGARWWFASQGWRDPLSTHCTLGLSDMGHCCRFILTLACRRITQPLGSIYNRYGLKWSISDTKGSMDAHVTNVAHLHWYYSELLKCQLLY